MKLQSYLRIMVNTNFIHLVKKNKCEICKSINNLEVHHIKPFSIILDETLEELNLILKDTENYSTDEIDLITNVILGKHLRYKYLTVCEECHKKLHDYTFYNINDNFKLHYEIENYKKQIAENGHIKSIIIPYLKENHNKRLFNNEKRELITTLNLKDSRGRIIKSISQINEYLKLKNIPYIINSKRAKINNVLQGFWIIK